VALVIDSKQESLVTRADANGEAVIELGSPRASTQWKIGRMSVNSIPGNASQVNVYVDEVLPQNVVDSTNSGDRDIADEFTAILVGPTSRLLIVWAGAAPDAECTANVQYDIEMITDYPDGF
jgi:hypothetical protein